MKRPTTAPRAVSMQILRNSDLLVAPVARAHILMLERRDAGDHIADKLSSIASGKRSFAFFAIPRNPDLPGTDLIDIQIRRDDTSRHASMPVLKASAWVLPSVEIADDRITIFDDAMPVSRMQTLRDKAACGDLTIGDIIGTGDLALDGVSLLSSRRVPAQVEAGNKTIFPFTAPPVTYLSLLADEMDAIAAERESHRSASPGTPPDTRR